MLDDSKDGNKKKNTEFQYLTYARGEQSQIKPLFTSGS